MKSKEGFRMEFLRRITYSLLIALLVVFLMGIFFAGFYWLLVLTSPLGDLGVLIIIGAIVFVSVALFAFLESK